MNIHRVIFRVDFKHINFAIIDSPGAIMKMLFEEKEDLFDEVLENYNNRQISGKVALKSEGIFGDLTIGPNTIIANLELEGGLEFSQLESNSHLNSFIQIAQKTIETFGVDKIGRFGLRFFCFSKSFENSRKSINAFVGLFPDKFTENIKLKLGTIEDIGLALDTKHDDGIYCKYKNGPYIAGENKKFLQHIHNNFDSNNDYNLIYDIDLYEKDFSTSGVKLSRKYKQLLSRAEDVAISNESVLKEN